ncbi:MAG: orotate phosphoribosyltransferase [Candidatus Bathyarchaeota archaeon]|nr:MAG: orotate phosphoribosyltransferase [Candidatus Bathyarchaeota archaeon]
MSLEKEREAMKAELCRILTKIDALKFGTFKLTSGRISPYYIDLRIVPSFPDVFTRICGLYVGLIKTELKADKFDRTAGIPTAGIPFASLIAYQLNKPFLYIRQRVRLHGRERRIEGLLMPGDRALLIDDLITTGVSLRKAAEAIRAEGGIVTDAVVLLDREEGGKENLAEDNITLHYLLRMSEAAEKLYEMDAIKEDQYKLILKQVKK